MPRIYNLQKYHDRRRWLRRHSSQAEILLWSSLKSRQFHGLKFRRQYSVDAVVLDFYCPALRLAIEIDGDTHFEPYQIRNDARRTAWLLSLNIQVVRFTNDRVIHGLDVVLEELWRFITSLHPSLRKEGRSSPTSGVG